MDHCLNFDSGNDRKFTLINFICIFKELSRRDDQPQVEQKEGLSIDSG